MEELKNWVYIIGGLITLIGFIKGLVEFSKANRIKRAEFLEKLILEFDDKKMFLAKRILDDFWIDINGAVGDSDIDLIKRGSIEKKSGTENSC
jgi:hypothetical protein